METWFIIVASLCVAFSLKSLFNLLGFSTSHRKIKNLPPGPTNVPVIGRLQWFRRSFSDIEPILRQLKSKYGPLITLRIGPNPAIFVASHSLAHQALVQNGVVFSDRPKAPPTSKIVTSNQRNISSASYGPTWRILRRNLTSEILHPSRIKSYSTARNWALGILLDRLRKDGESGSGVKLMDHFQYAVFCLLVLMCFGDKLGEEKIREIEKAQRRLLVGFRRFNIINFFPRIGRIIFPGRWRELIETRKEQERIFVPLIHARAQSKHGESCEQHGADEVAAYVDSLLNLELPEEKRKLNDGEIVSLISEFLSAGTDTTATALQWIMANLVNRPEIQEKVYQEICSFMGPPGHGKIVREEDLAGMRYVKAAVLEGLRRHPPGHFVLPHTVTEEAELSGYTIPKNATVNFMVAEMGVDPTVWDDPLEFKPERFLTDGNGGEMFDLTGSREIKMMPFGAGRRICPGLGLALLHLEYFVANLVWCFEWKCVEGEKVDLEEEPEFTVVMKNPLRAKLRLRSSS